MHDLLDLVRYPLDRPDSASLTSLVAHCRAELAEQGMFNLDGFVRADAIEQAARELQPLSTHSAYRHHRRHNVYFEDTVAGLAPDHPALRLFETTNYTLCGDQLQGTLVERIYEWQPLIDFLARVMDKPALHRMDDPLARLNVMAYRPGEALNWHFDRARFTTTLLIQAAESGGEFEYASGLRSESDPNYEGVGRLLAGDGPAPAHNPLSPGTLNVFAGRDTLHRVTPVGGARDRLVAVFSYYDRPGVQFSASERLGFYGREH